jgi:hypothetical protein
MLFDSFRSIGLVASGTPSPIRHLGTKHFMSVPAGRAFFVYDLERLTVALISRQAKAEISLLATGDDGEYTFCACGSGLAKFRRAEQVAFLDFGSPVCQLLLLGKTLLVVTKQGDLFVIEVVEFELPAAPALQLGSEFGCTQVSLCCESRLFL